MPSNRQDISHHPSPLSNLGEAGIIELVRSKSVTKNYPNVIHAIGDDCAVLKFTDKKDLLVTTDTMVKETHFTAQTLPADALGWKVLASNISDIAAMGGTPRTAFLSLGLNSKTTTDFLESFITALSDLAQKTNIALAGGDTVETPCGQTITLTLLGDCPRGKAIYRHKAQLDDDIWVSGRPGDAAGGLFILQEGLPSESAQHKTLVRAHQRPVPRVELGRALGKSGLVHAMIDISDGIAKDLGHICEQSRVGAILDETAIPITEDLRLLGDETGRNPMDWTLYGGEDYELLFTAPPAHRQALKAMVCQNSDIPIHRIGKIVSKPVFSLVGTEGTRDIGSHGYSHFSR